MSLVSLPCPPEVCWHGRGRATAAPVGAWAPWLHCLSCCLLPPQLWPGLHDEQARGLPESGAAMTCMDATGGLISVPAALGAGADVSHVTGAVNLTQSAPTVHVAHTASQVEKLAAACAGHLVAPTHRLCTLSLHLAQAADELLLAVQEICWHPPTACMASHCILLWLQRSCCCQ